MRAGILAIALASACSDSPGPDPGRSGEDGVRPPSLATVQAAVEVRELLEERTRAVLRAPLDGALWFELAVAYDAHSLYHLAEICYGEAARFAPEDERAWYHLARTRAELSHLDEALVAMDRSIALESGHAPSHWRRGFWLLDLGRTDEAAVAFARAVELAPEDGAGHVGLARVDLEQGRFADAARRLEGVLEHDEENGYARQLLGSAYRLEGRDDEAREQLLRSQHARPVWRDSWVAEVERAGTSLLDRLDRLREEIRAGRGAEALETLEATLAEHPTHIAVLSTITPALVQAGRIERAIEINEAALELGRDHTRIHLNLALLYPQRGEVELGIEHARRAVELNPASSDAPLQLARLLLAGDRLGEAGDALELAIENGDGRVSTRLMLASARGRLGRWRDAERVLLETLEEHPGSSDAYVLLAGVRLDLGDLGGATQALQSAADLGHDERVVSEIARRLRDAETKERDGG